MPNEWLTTTANRFIDLEGGSGFLRDLLSIEEHSLAFAELDLEGAVDVLRQLWRDPTQELRDRLEEFVPDVDELRERAGQLLLEQLPEELRFLFVRFAELGQRPEAGTEYHWPLFDQKLSGEEQPAGGLLLSLDAGIALNQTIQPLAQLPVGVAADPQRSEILRLALDGALTLGQALSGIGPGLSMNLEGSVSAGCGVELFYRHFSERRVGEALLLDLRRFGSPFSIEALQQGFFQGNLAAVQCRVEHQTSLSGKVGFSRDLDLGDLIKGSLGLSFGFKKSLAGEFDYLIHPTGTDRQIALKLRRVVRREDEQSRSLGLQLDLSDWARQVYPMIQGELGKAQALLDRFKDLIPGQGLFREKLGAALSEVLGDFEHKPVLLQGLGIAGKGDLGDALTQALLNEIEGQRSLWRGDLQERSEQIKAELLNRLPLGVDLRNQLDDTLQQALIRGLGDLRKSLDEQLQSLVKGSGYSDIAEQLNGLGHRVDKGIRKLDKRVEALSAPLREELDRLQQRLNELKGRFDDASKAKISMGLDALTRELGSRDLTLSLVLDADHPAAQDLLTALLTANLDGLLEKIREHQSDGQGSSAILSATGTLTRYTRLTQEQGFTCVLFGNGFSGRTRIDADARLVVDAHGNIQCLSGMEFNRRYQGMHDERELQIIDSVELAAARASRNISLAVNLSMTDEDLTPQEAIDFFNSAERVGLLKPGTSARAASALSATNLKSGRLDLGMTLSKAQLLNLLQIVDEKTPLDAQPIESEVVFEIAARNMADICNQQPPSRELLVTLEQLRKELPGYGVAAGVDLRDMILGMGRERFRESDKWLETIYGDQLSKILQASNALSWVRARQVAVLGCHGDCRGKLRQVLIEGLGQADIGDLQNRQFGLLDALELMREVYTWDPNRDLESLRRRQSEIGQAVKSWFLWQGDFPKWWMLNTKEIRPLTLAFFRTVADLARTADDIEPPMLSAALTLKGERGVDRKRIALT